MPLDPADYQPRPGYVDPWVAVKYLLLTQRSALSKLALRPGKPLSNKTLSRWWAVDKLRRVGPFKAQSDFAKPARKIVLANRIVAATYNYVQLSDLVVHTETGLKSMPKPVPMPKAVHRIHPDDRALYVRALKALLQEAQRTTQIPFTPHSLAAVLRCERPLTADQINYAAVLTGIDSAALAAVRLTTTPSQELTP